MAREGVTRKRDKNGRWMHFRDGRLISKGEYERSKGRASGSRKASTRSRATTTRSKTMATAKKTTKRRRAAPRTKEVAGFELGWQPDWNKTAEGAVAGAIVGLVRNYGGEKLGNWTEPVALAAAGAIVGLVRNYGGEKLGNWTEPVALAAAGAITGNQTMQTFSGYSAAQVLVTTLPGGAAPGATPGGNSAVVV